MCFLTLQDDPIGAEFPLCESDFNSEDSEDNMVRWFADTQFDAVLFCGDCKLPSPPPPPAASDDPNSAVTSFAAVSSFLMCCFQHYGMVGKSEMRCGLRDMIKVVCEYQQNFTTLLLSCS